VVRLDRAETMSVIDAIQALYRAEWKVADELAAVPVTQLEQIAEQIERAGIDGYSIFHLRGLRGFALRFPQSERLPNISPRVHRSAGSPELLASLARSGSKPVSRKAVRRLRREMRDLAHRRAIERRADLR